MRYIFALILIGFAVFIIWKTDVMIRAFGRIAWAEQKLGYGGTWTFYKAGGLILIILAFVIMSGGYTRILDLIFVH